MSRNAILEEKKKKCNLQRLALVCIARLIKPKLILKEVFTIEVFEVGFLRCDGIDDFSYEVGIFNASKSAVLWLQTKLIP